MKIKPIGVTDNIFELGVDSVIAAQLFAQIEKKLGMDLPPAPLFEAPTIESLAALLSGAGEDRNSRRWTSLVELQPHGSRTPLFCVHGGAGTVLLFHPLASYLAPERPVYAFQAQGLYGRELPHTNFEDMAAHYIKEMRTVQPHGPYLLTGWCSGGIIAFEMAQQLARMREEVAMLATLNAPSSPEFNCLEPASLLPITARLERRWQELRGLTLPRKFHYLGQKSLGQLRWRMHALRLRRRQLALRASNRIRPLPTIFSWIATALYPPTCGSPISLTSLRSLSTVIATSSTMGILWSSEISRPTRIPYKDGDVSFVTLWVTKFQSTWIIIAGYFRNQLLDFSLRRWRSTLDAKRRFSCVIVSSVHDHSEPLS